MSGQMPFDVDQIDSVVRHLGDLHYVVDGLNGADILFSAPDMVDTANRIVAEYKNSVWPPRTVPVHVKTVIPPGHIVGYRSPSGTDGPYHDAVWLLTPAGSVPPRRAIEVQDLDEVTPE